jgi:hypothetical protein
MPTCNEPLFSYTDLPLLAPWLTGEICRELTESGLFPPRMTRRAPEAELPHLSLYDLIALTGLQQLLRSGIPADQLLQALCAPSSFRCDDFSEEDLLFLSTGGNRGQELSRFLEVTNAEVTILVRLPVIGDAAIEFVPNELLGARDFKGETLTAVECRAIRDIIKVNIASAEHDAGKGENDLRVPTQA